MKIHRSTYYSGRPGVPPRRWQSGVWDQARLPDGGIAKHRASEEPATARVISEGPHSRVVLGDAPQE